MLNFLFSQRRRRQKEEGLPGAFLIAGLGNPGIRYARTRHNLGKRVLEQWMAEGSWVLRKESRLEAEVARGSIGGETVLLCLPSVYMNHSGEAIRRVVRHFQISLERLVVVVDDVALPFGKLRFAQQGRTGGHNGLLSVEQNLGTQCYSRLRIGIDCVAPEGDLTQYVLGEFTEEETKKLPHVFQRVVQMLTIWVSRGPEAAKHGCAQEKLYKELGGHVEEGK